MMGERTEIPLIPSQNQNFDIALGILTYHLTFIWNDQMDGGWYMDIDDDQGNELCHGIPLVTGADLLAQYPELGIPGTMTVETDHDALAPPTFDNIGTSSHLYFTPND